jgi:hypothetical protein
MAGITHEWTEASSANFCGEGLSPRVSMCLRMICSAS